MKILIVAPVIWPFQSPRSFRSTELAKELARNHQVTLFSNTRGADYSEFEKEFGLDVKPFKQLKFIKKHAVHNEKNTFLNKVFNKLFRKVLNFPNIEFLWNIPKSLKNESGYDILISIAYPYPVHFGVARAKKKNPNLTQTWIADCGDPFAGEQEGRLKNPFYYKMIEKWFCLQPDYITIPIKEAITSYLSICHHKLKVIPI